MRTVATRLATDLALMVGWSVVVGATAPRWPRAMVDHDHTVLRLTRWDTPQNYRRLPVAWLGRTVPDAGTWFGGRSKTRLAGSSPAALTAYAVEARRAELVHVLCAAVAVPLVTAELRRSRSAALVVGLVAAAANVPCWLVVRRNRVRLASIEARRTGPVAHSGQRSGGRTRRAGG